MRLLSEPSITRPQMPDAPFVRPSLMSHSPIEKHKSTLLDGIKTTVDDPVLLARRRKQITDASIQVFRRLGYHPATIRDVAKQADVSVGLIYQYIGDKEDLLFLSLVEILSDYKKGIPRALEGIFDPLERLCTAVRAYCRVHDAPEAATVLAYRETASLRKERRNAIRRARRGYRR
jgi:TetR/AcrR family transcriptional regulator, cholesterol catabolism regulator